MYPLVTENQLKLFIQYINLVEPFLYFFTIMA